MPAKEQNRDLSEQAALNRRQLLGQVALAGAGAAGLAIMRPRTALADPSLQQGLMAVWTPGNTAQATGPGSLRGFLTTQVAAVAQQDFGGNTFFFPISTPVFLDGRRSRINQVILDFDTSGANAVVMSVDVSMGRYTPWRFSNLRLSGQPHPFESFKTGGQNEVVGGITIAVFVSFQTGGSITFYGVGVELI